MVTTTMEIIVEAQQILMGTSQSNNMVKETEISKPSGEKK